jgi:hypothetical protein
MSLFKYLEISSEWLRFGNNLKTQHFASLADERSQMAGRQLFRAC